MASVPSAGLSWWDTPAPRAVAASPPRDAGQGEEVQASRDTRRWGLIITAVVATAVGSVGVMLLAAGMVPGLVSHAELALRRGPWKMVFLGIASVLILFLVAAVLFKASEAGARVLGVVGVAVLAFLLWLGSIGLSASAKVVGQRLLGDEDGTQSHWRSVGAGALAIAAAALVPAVGQGMFIFLLCRGVGAAALALFPTRPAPAPQSSSSSSSSS
ncbi:MAG: hypothetical protein FJ291_14410 [Planctomycetes bacterium]|nr:hypothetical protein [Planctomycetota bacterium]